MGAFLDKPKTEKETVSGTGYGGIKYAVSAMQGWRMEMEDAHVCETQSFCKNCSIFGVFDGHAGPKAANYCAKNLVRSITENFSKDKMDSEPKEEEVVSAIRKGFFKLDEELKPHLNDDRSGTTAVIAVVMPDKIIWGNCGDSRGFLCRKGSPFFATVDHKPYNDGEKYRIEKAGGTVMMQRVNGSLAVSRALGDFDYKRNNQLESYEQLVSPEPEIDARKRDHDNDEFLLLACDGIFDVMTNEQVIEYVLHQLEVEESLEKICSDLIDLCLHKNSRDNMSVVLVTFPAAPKVSEAAKEKDKKLREEGIRKSKKAILDMVEKATDPLDLEEVAVMASLADSMSSELDIFTIKEEIVKFLTEERMKRFKDKTNDEQNEFSGTSDPEDMPSILSGRGSELPPDEMGSPRDAPENKSDFLVHQPSDMPAREDSDSTTNNTIM